MFEAASKSPPILRPAGDFTSAKLPAPILWRDPGALEAHDHDRCDVVLSIGEVALLSAAGGLGKSYITLAVANAAAEALAASNDYGAACGLRVKAGPVVLVSFEDSAVRIAHRLQLMTAGNVPADIHVAPDPAPLWTAEGDKGGASAPAANWPRLWAAIRQTGARLVVIDPASAALADVSTSETGPVRAFLRELALAATPDPTADWPGCGVLLVAHSTKAGRNAMAAGEAPDAGVVAGSAAWYDGARGVLTVWNDRVSDDRIMECVKANYGRTGWGARLQERIVNGRFAGLELDDRLKREAVETARTAKSSKPQAIKPGHPAANPIT